MLVSAGAGDGGRLLGRHAGVGDHCGRHVRDAVTGGDGLHRSRDHLMLASDGDLHRCWRWGW